jgi:dihydroxyacid dehydratase/phosphogluconate dehydratase
MELQRISGLARKPLILPVSPQVTGGELQMLREAAVIAVAVEGDSKAAFDALASLRKVIDELPPRRRRREEHGEAILPRVAEAVASAPEEDDDEEEEEDW